MSLSTVAIDQRLVSLTRPASLEADQYQSLRLSLQRLKAARDVRMIAMTSPTTGDGKTLTAINLAGALAGVGSRVLLIEADLRRPSVADQLGIRGDTAPGLADLVLDPALMVQDALLPLNLGFDVITAGSPSAAVREVFNSPRLETLLREARAHYDFVALDTPPVVPVYDCRLLAPLVDGLLLVVAAHRTPRKLVEESLNLLDSSRVLGIVFNRDDNPLLGYHRRHYYGCRTAKAAQP